MISFLQLSFGIAKMTGMNNLSGLGLLAVGSAPGGGGSNVFTKLLDGDLELSITMSFISTLVSLGNVVIIEKLKKFFY